MMSLEKYQQKVEEAEISTAKKATKNLVGMFLLCIFLVILLIMISNLLKLPTIMYFAILAVGVVTLSTLIDVSAESKGFFKAMLIIRWLWIPELLAVAYLYFMFKAD